MKKELGEADIPVISVILVMRQLDAALDAGFSQSPEFKVPVLGPSREGFSFVGANDLITEAWGDVGSESHSAKAASRGPDRGW